MSQIRPVLFNGEMVRAILEGRKTQTRRILSLPAGWEFKASDSEPCILGRITSPHPKKGRFGAFIRREIYKDSGKFEHDIVTCKYGQPGDRLWVRESFWGCDLPGYGDQPCVVYEDEHHGKSYKPSQERPWANKFGHIPSIHMPKRCSRITLEITDVRVERLQDISEKDAKAEGVWKYGNEESWKIYTKTTSFGTICPRRSFETLWQSINGPDSTHANPWVWVIEFKRIDQEASAA